MAGHSDIFPSRAPEEDDDDWGSDFEGELCSQEIEDNKINEIREANFLKNVPNVKDMAGDISQIIQTTRGNRIINETNTGAIPKLGFSYLSNMIPDANKASPLINTDAIRITVQTTGKESENHIHPQRQMSQPPSQSRNPSTSLENSEGQPKTQVVSNNDAATKKTPRKLRPEAFSFLNKMPQRNITETGNEVGKERKTLVPTAFSYAEKLTFTQSQDVTNTLRSESFKFVSETPSAPPLENSTSNYEPIPDDSLSEMLPASSIVSKENVKPPLPSRPPPVFKYPPETFSSIRSTSIESSGNLATSLPQPSPAYPKLGHSISSPEKGLKYTSEDIPNLMVGTKEKNRRSLPSVPVYPPVPKRPLPPLPISDTENFSRIKTQSETSHLENPVSKNDESWPEEAPTIPGTILSRQTNQLSACEGPLQHTAFKEPPLQEQLLSNPQHRLAQILTNQTSVNSAVLLSQKKIASAITSRATRSQSSSIASLNNIEGSEFQNGGKPQELIRVIPERSLENDAEQRNEDEPERQSSYLEAKEIVNPRRFPDPETLINAMNRPVLPQKAAPIQRSVSCNSLVQSIKDLSFSVWSKPEKKRNSDGISLSKKNTRSISLATPSKVKCSPPLSITLIPTDAPREVMNPQPRKDDACRTDEKSLLLNYPWFHDVDAKEGQLRLLSVGQDGTFLIRPSSRPTEDIQNTLCILYNRKVRNLHIRRTADGRYVLGTKSSKNFSSLEDIIRHHKEFPVEILPQGSTPIIPQLYRILLKETPPKLQKQFPTVQL